MIVLANDGHCFQDAKIEELQKYFDEGWDYVDKLCQSVSTGGGSYHETERSEVIAIIKRKKSDLI